MLRARGRRVLRAKRFRMRHRRLDPSSASALSTIKVAVFHWHVQPPASQPPPAQRQPSVTHARCPSEHLLRAQGWHLFADSVSAPKATAELAWGTPSTRPRGESTDRALREGGGHSLCPKPPAPDSVPAYFKLRQNVPVRVNFFHQDPSRMTHYKSNHGTQWKERVGDPQRKHHTKVNENSISTRKLP